MANSSDLKVSKPRILIVGHRHKRKARWVDYVGEHHLELILRFGGVPIMVPRIAGMKASLDAMGDMDGLLLVEGEDVDPARYGLGKAGDLPVEEPDLARDEVEFELLDRALRVNVPIFGICRGCHVLNIACGGSLYTDVKQDKGSSLDHVALEHEAYDTYRHRIRIEKTSPLAGWYEQNEMGVNSYHHQGVKVLAPGLVAMSFSDDGLVEAFYDPEKKFRVGIQFHPERMLGEWPKGARIYRAFVQAARDFQVKGSR